MIPNTLFQLKICVLLSSCGLLISSCTRSPISSSSLESHQLRNAIVASSTKGLGSEKKAAQGEDSSLSVGDPELVEELKLLIKNDRDEAAELKRMSSRLGKFCDQLYELRMNCPLLAHIVTTVAPPVQCKKTQLVRSAFVDVMFAFPESKNLQGFFQKLQLILETKGGQQFMVAIPPGVDTVEAADFADLKTASRNSSKKFKDVTKVILQSKNQSAIKIPAHEVCLRIEVNDVSILGEDATQFCVVMTADSEHRYVLAGGKLHYLFELRKTSDCRPSIQDLLQPVKVTSVK